MIFIYKARNGKGELIEGEIDAKGVLEAKYMLAEDGLFPTSVGSKGISISLPNFIKLRGKVKVKELINLTRQFYALFKAGINMDRILFTLARQSPTQQMKNAMESIRRDVASG